jgi:23S rRNA pseudouridine2605 synthase
MNRRPPRARERDDSDERPAGERLQRVLAARGVASRRASEQLIVDGRVQVNGRTVTELGTRVDPLHDEVRVDGKVLRRQRPRFIILNKPSGFITTVSDEKQRWTVMDLVEIPERVYPVGRLDRETQGLLLLTNDGNVANRVMHPKYGLAKEYHVITHKRPNDRQLQRVREGIEIEGKLVVPDECRLLREGAEGIIVKIVIHEGLYHVVRQMMQAVDIEVVKLRRVRIGPLTVQGIPSGAWRDLTPGELAQLFDALGLPAEDAERANASRPMQLTPVGGFQHAPRVAHPPRGAGRPPETRPDAGPRPSPAPGPGPGPRRDDRRRDTRRPEDHGWQSSPPDRGPRRTGKPERTPPGRKNDGPRPSDGHRNRRPGRGR